MPQYWAGVGGFFRAFVGGRVAAGAFGAEAGQHLPGAGEDGGAAPFAVEGVCGIEGGGVAWQCLIILPDCTGYFAL